MNYECKVQKNKKQSVEILEAGVEKSNSIEELCPCGKFISLIWKASYEL